jgi:hypothetical protein
LGAAALGYAGYAAYNTYAAYMGSAGVAKAMQAAESLPSAKQDETSQKTSKANKIAQHKKQLQKLQQYVQGTCQTDDGTGHQRETCNMLIRMVAFMQEQRPPYDEHDLAQAIRLVHEDTFHIHAGLLDVALQQRVDIAQAPTASQAAVQATDQALANAYGNAYRAHTNLASTRSAEDKHRNHQWQRAMAQVGLLKVKTSFTGTVHTLAELAARGAIGDNQPLNGTLVWDTVVFEHINKKFDAHQLYDAGVAGPGGGGRRRSAFHQGLRNAKYRLVGEPFQVRLGDNINNKVVHELHNTEGVQVVNIEDRAGTGVRRFGSSSGREGAIDIKITNQNAAARDFVRQCTNNDMNAVFCARLGARLGSDDTTGRDEQLEDTIFVVSEKLEDKAAMQEEISVLAVQTVFAALEQNMPFETFQQLALTYMRQTEQQLGVEAIPASTTTGVDTAFAINAVTAMLLPNVDGVTPALTRAQRQVLAHAGTSGFSQMALDVVQQHSRNNLELQQVYSEMLHMQESIQRETDAVYTDIHNSVATYGPNIYLQPRVWAKFHTVDFAHVQRLYDQKLIAPISLARYLRMGFSTSTGIVQQYHDWQREPLSFQHLPTVPSAEDVFVSQQLQTLDAKLLRDLAPLPVIHDTITNLYYWLNRAGMLQGTGLEQYAESLEELVVDNQFVCSDTLESVQTLVTNIKIANGLAKKGQAAVDAYKIMFALQNTQYIRRSMRIAKLKDTATAAYTMAKSSGYGGQVVAMLGNMYNTKTVATPAVSVLAQAGGWLTKAASLPGVSAILQIGGAATGTVSGAVAASGLGPALAILGTITTAYTVAQVGLGVLNYARDYEGQIEQAFIKDLPTIMAAYYLLWGDNASSIFRIGDDAEAEAILETLERKVISIIMKLAERFAQLPNSSRLDLQQAMQTLAAMMIIWPWPATRAHCYLKEEYVSPDFRWTKTNSRVPMLRVMLPEQMNAELSLSREEQQKMLAWAKDQEYNQEAPIMPNLKEDHIEVAITLQKELRARHTREQRAARRKGQNQDHHRATAKMPDFMMIQKDFEQQYGGNNTAPSEWDEISSDEEEEEEEEAY